jgi:recombinational DNA repair protein (RecF pathway)
MSEVINGFEAWMVKNMEIKLGVEHRYALCKRCGTETDREYDFIYLGEEICVECFHDQAIELLNAADLEGLEIESIEPVKDDNENATGVCVTASWPDKLIERVEATFSLEELINEAQTNES